MRITPQIVLESIETLKDTAVLQKETLPYVKSLLDQAVLFTFEDVDNKDPEHLAFAVDLFERNLFTLPFPVVALSFEKLQDNQLRGGMIILTLNKGTLTSLHCSEVQNPISNCKAIPIAATINATVKSISPEEASITGDTFAIVNDKIKDYMFADQDALEQRMMRNTINAMALVIVLMSKGVTSVYTSTPHKLNKLRQKNNKPPIRDRYNITINPLKSKILYQDDNSTQDITSHERGSPRIHWRRGHFRTIHRDTDKQKIIPVAPALIGANENAEEVKKKLYEVR